MAVRMETIRISNMRTDTPMIAVIMIKRLLESVGTVEDCVDDGVVGLSLTTAIMKMIMIKNMSVLSFKSQTRV